MLCSSVLWRYAVSSLLMLWTRETDAYYPEECSLTQSGSARLVGLGSSYVGVVQVCYDGYWTVLSNQEEQEWTQKNSMVACRELGFHGSYRIFSQNGIPLSESLPNTMPSDSLPPSSTPNGPRPPSARVYDSVECSGLESKLVDCMWHTKTKKQELSLRDVMVLCRDKPLASEVALVGINGKDSEGLVIIYNSLKTRLNGWSFICPTQWDDEDAAVACRQLGFNGGTSITYSSNQVGDTGLLHNKPYSNFECSGSEERLNECRYLFSIPYESCSAEYAGVVCTTEPKDSESHQGQNLTFVLLGLMIGITLLLIVILLVILKFTLKKFMAKPSPARTSRASRGTRGARPATNRILHTQLDAEVPYAAPPSYGDTLRADRRVQQTDTMAPVTGEEDEAQLIVEDELSNTETNDS